MFIHNAIHFPSYRHCEECSETKWRGNPLEQFHFAYSLHLNPTLILLSCPQSSSKIYVVLIMYEISCVLLMLCDEMLSSRDIHPHHCPIPRYKRRHWERKTWSRSTNFRDATTMALTSWQFSQRLSLLVPIMDWSMRLRSPIPVKISDPSNGLDWRGNLHYW